MTDEKDKKPETCTSECRAYRVEVRACHRPIQMGDTIIGERWVPLPTVKSFPLGTSYQRPADELTYTNNYYGAIALAASAMSSVRLDEIQTRIVEYRRVVKYELHREGEQELPDAVARMFGDAERGAERGAERRRKESEGGNGHE